MADTDKLRRNLAAAEAELAEVQAAIAAALADDADARHLQARRDKLEAKVRDLAPAITLAESREADLAQRARAEEAARLTEAASEADAAMLAAADGVDAAIAALGEAYSVYTLAMLDAKRARQRAGSDLNAVVRATEHSLRWAMASGARHFMEAMGAARVPVHRETPFGASVRRVLPKLKETDR